MELRDKIEEISKKYPDKRSAVMPALYLVQDKYGYLTKEAMEEVAVALNLPPVQVYEIATFYTMYNKKPVGKYHIQLCTNVSCMLLGSEDILGYLKEKLGVDEGETTEDGLFTLSTVECLGSCGTAPVMQINDTYYEGITKDKVDKILEGLGS